MLFSAILPALLLVGTHASPPLSFKLPVPYPSVVVAPAATTTTPTTPDPDFKVIYETAYAKDRSAWLSNITTDPFYEAPLNTSSTLPGDILRLEKVSREKLQQYTIPPGLTLYRMLYLSLDINNNPVPASAYILLPYNRPSAGQLLPVIVWAHGTAGIDRQCAPSNRRNLYYDYDGPYSMALRGYAVIAPDYAGLGTNTTYYYMAAPSHALDVAYAVTAARKSLPQGIIGRDWVIVGHSEGGLTAWLTNEQQLTHPIGGFRGSVAIAPALQNIHILKYAVEQNNTGSSMLYSPYTLHAIARMYPSVHVNDYLTDLGIERTRLARTGCYETAKAVFSNVSYSDIVKDSSWLNSTWAAEWEARTAVSGAKRLAQPLLLIEAQGDIAVFPAILEAVFERHCATNQANTHVQLSRYPEVDHDVVTFVSQVEYFNWIADRFNGVEAAKGCSNSTADVVRASNNRLVTQACTSL